MGGEPSIDLSYSVDKLDIDVVHDMEQAEQERITEITAVADFISQAISPSPLSKKQKTWPPDPNFVDSVELEPIEELPPEPTKLAQQLYMISGIRDPPGVDISDPTSKIITEPAEEEMLAYYDVEWF